MTRWLGIDVGGKRKGFDLALVDERRLLTLAGRLDREAVIRIADEHRPVVIAIDSPRCCAPPGMTARDDERALARSICGIRWTPDEETVRGNPYYAWILEGLGLFHAFAEVGANVIEVFPTASWTRWYGRRDGRTRAAWSQTALSELRLDNVPPRTNQDQRDAIAAAVTAREHTQGTTEAIGDIVIPGRKI